MKTLKRICTDEMKTDTGYFLFYNDTAIEFVSQPRKSKGLPSAAITHDRRNNDLSYYKKLGMIK